MFDRRNKMCKTPLKLTEEYRTASLDIVAEITNKLSGITTIEGMKALLYDIESRTNDYSYEVTDDDYVSEVLENGEIPVLLSVYQKNSIMCRDHLISINKIGKKYGNTIKFVKLNGNTNPQTIGKLNVKGVPTMVFYQRGKVIARLNNSLPITKMMTWVADVKRQARDFEKQITESIKNDATDEFGIALSNEPHKDDKICSSVLKQIVK